MARSLRRLAVTLPVSGVLLIVTAGPAVANPGSDPPGNSQASANANPDNNGKGSPHQQADPSPSPDSGAADPAPSSSTDSTTSSQTTTAPSSSSSSSGDSVGVSIISSAAAFEAAAKPTGNQGGGKPCNGCVGNADGKQPPGQTRNRELGHECDDNKGVGKGNPAHSGCTTTPTTTTTTNTTTPTTDTTTPTVSTTPTTAVLGETVTRSVPGTKVLGVTATRGALATTGSGNVTDLTMAALGLVLVGHVLIRRARTT